MRMLANAVVEWVKKLTMECVYPVAARNITGLREEEPKKRGGGALSRETPAWACFRGVREVQ